MTNDPALPDGFDVAALGAAALIAATNFGLDAPLAEQGPAPPHPPGAPATLPIDPAAAHAFLQACIDAHPRVRYGAHPGAKVPFHGAVPGTGFTEVDCSGFVRELVFRATTPPFDFPDGSVVQRDWVQGQGFATDTIDHAGTRDGAMRIAFLAPQDSPSRIGHVVVIHNGMTLESHGGLGPDSLPWTGQAWQSKARVFVLRPG